MTRLERKVRVNRSISKLALAADLIKEVGYELSFNKSFKNTSTDIYLKIIGLGVRAAGIKKNAKLR